MTNQLPTRQKWLLAIQLLLLYLPVSLFVNLPTSARSWAGLIHGLPFLVALSLIAFGVYFVWITVIDWIQHRLTGWFGDNFLLEFSWLSLLLTILISALLAFLYIVVNQALVSSFFSLINKVWPALLPRSTAPAISPEALLYVQRVGYGFAVVIMLSAYYITNNARAYQQLKNVQLRAELLEKGAVVSQFEALKNQISPHFLFNSLSILTSLVHEDPVLSEKFIKQLAKAYRYILEQRDHNLVPLHIELDFIEAYTFLLKIRFENKFDVLIDVPQPTQEGYQIAPLSLQMLVENAVKHNRMSLREPLQVRIHVMNEYLVVENPIQDRDQPVFSTGIGLQNITDRYALLTSQPVQCGPEGGRFVVKIPLLTSERVKE